MSEGQLRDEVITLLLADHETRHSSLDVVSARPAP